MLNILFEKNNFKFWFASYDGNFWDGVGDNSDLDNKSLCLYIKHKDNKSRARFFRVMHGEILYEESYPVSEEVKEYIKRKLNLLPFV